MKSLEMGDPFLSGKIYRLAATIKDGISGDNAKKVTALIRQDGPKTVKATIQGDEIRVSSKSRDDLQQTIALLKSADLEIDLQFVNYR